MMGRRGELTEKAPNEKGSSDVQYTGPPVADQPKRGCLNVGLQRFNFNIYSVAQTLPVQLDRDSIPHRSY